MTRCLPSRHQPSVGAVPFCLHTRYYQPDVFKELTELVPSEPQVALLLPTGSGKTTLILSFIAWVFEQPKPPFSEVYVIAPQKTVRDGFKGNKGENRQFQVNPGEACYELVSAEDLDSRTSLDETGDLDTKLLEVPKPGTKVWFAETHAKFALEKLLCNLQNHCCTADFHGKLLVVDEGHHAKLGNNIRAFIDYWVANGGHVLYATATPGDGIPETAKLIQRTLTELMAPPYDLPPCAPTRILSNFIDTGLAEDSEQDADGTHCAPIGTEAELRNVFEDMATRWNDAGRPKTIVRIKPKQDTQHNIKMLLMAKKAFEDVGARAFAVRADVNLKTGSEIKRIDGLISSEDLSEKLAKERRRSYSESECDVIITLNTMIEGADWPLCSHVYLWGVPGNCQTTVQVLGRATRLRTGISDYPQQWCETTQIVFFVGGVSDLRNTHGTTMLLVGCSLANYTLGAQWSTFREHLKLVKEHPQILEPAREEATAVPAEREREIRLGISGLSKTIEKFQNTKERVENSEVHERRKRIIEKHLSTLPDGPERRFGISFALGEYPGYQEKYRKALRGRLQTESFSEAHKAVLDELLEHFLNSTEVLPRAGSLMDLEDMGLLQLTAPVLEGLKDKMLKECPPRLYRSKVINNTQSFVISNPHLSISELLDQPDPASPDGYTFRAYDEAIRAGSRGLERHDDGLGGMVCERSSWSKEWVTSAHLDQLKGGTSQKRFASEFKKHPLGFFFGPPITNLLKGLPLDVCARLTVGEAVRIGRSEWTKEQYASFKGRLQHMTVQEALDGV